MQRDIKTCHKLATRNFRTIQGMADFCGLARGDILWQISPVLAVSFQNISLSD
jgi:hypothetical protein